MGYSIGIDVGSTTVKVIAVDDSDRVVFKDYRRHHSDIGKTVREMLSDCGIKNAAAAVTGSGGIKLSERLNLEFVQEVVAVTSAIEKTAPETDVVIELGGEDAKIIYLTNGIEQRMNGICAGGTGAFIDQMAALLNTDAKGLNDLAEGYKELFPIAARCGVFAKSDIQPLINEGVSRNDLAASIFQAVVNQTISGLACGRKITGNVAFLGGPLYFLPELREAFTRTLGLKPEEEIFPENAHLFAALGTAEKAREFEENDIEEIVDKLETVHVMSDENRTLPKLFENEEELTDFNERQKRYVTGTKDLESYTGDIFLGIDAGSTTSKVALIDDENNLLYTWYGSNSGDPVATIKGVIKDIDQKINPGARIRYSCSTGYGETLVRDAFSLDMGEVETVAHYYAASHYEPDVDCILDIGGQDMKCIRIKDGSIDNILLNEACSSGCGSFIEGFANSLGYTAAEFSKLALTAEKPVDLGTRCTVFMNSNVKQAQKEGASVNDIAAGLAYSVIKNALFKVIKLTDAKSLGRKVVVQGGTFYSDAVLRAFEKISGTEAVRPDIAGLMGAYGAALIAREEYYLAEEPETAMLPLSEAADVKYKTSQTNCKGCENRCRLSVITFSNGNRHISGNRCEKLTSRGNSAEDIPNVAEYKRKRMFYYKSLPENQAIRGDIGIPRVLNMYEDFPYWATFFRELKFRVILSPETTAQMYRKGMDSIPSESECYPAKVAHGHVRWLIDHGVRNIFYPCIYYERSERKTAINSFNCPMVIAYPENIRNNMDELKNGFIRYFDPFVALTQSKVARLKLENYMFDNFKVPYTETKNACEKAWRELMRARAEIRREGERAIEWMEKHHRKGIVLAGRPYHIDPMINHGIPELIQSYGFAVLTEDSIAHRGTKRKLRVADQWMYHSRLYAAADYVRTRDDLELIQLNSFGCGIDAVTTDQVQEILNKSGKLYTLLKIDEINNLGAAKIRIRSLMAAIRMRENREIIDEVEDFKRVEYTAKMQKDEYTILCTHMAPFHCELLEAALNSCNYNVRMLREERPSAIDMGLKYVNNDACLPAMIVTGQLIDAVESGDFDLNRLAILTVQTGGSCRATNYAGFIRRALENAGFGDIPVICLSAKGIEANSGFHITPKMGIKMMQSVFLGDLFMKVLLRTRPYEEVKGSADKLYNEWNEKGREFILAPGTRQRKFNRMCEEVIHDFDCLRLKDMPRKTRVGIVGEVLVKFMPFANNHLIDTLEQEGAEVVMPGLTEFMEYCASNAQYRADNLGGSKITKLASRVAIRFIDLTRTRVHRALDRSYRFERPDNIYKTMKRSQAVVQSGIHSGEGWFLAGEIIDLIEDGIKNVVCVQPFGCLPNHIVGKGMIKKIRELHPGTNIVAIDYDPSASEVNQLNRIKLLLQNAEYIKERQAE